jgi:hypothetical protein
MGDKAGRWMKMEGKAQSTAQQAELQCLVPYKP